MVIAESTAANEKELIARFGEEYRLGQTEIMRRIERAVCGCDYGGTSWTTRDEAQAMGDLLGLKPGTRLLEVGAGAGWPGLYLAGVTGCDAVLADLPLEGLKIAAQRAATERLSGACRFVVADGTVLPLQSGCFEAVVHSDVLCCLDAKLSVLKECRRVLGEGGKMVFTVISIAPGLSPADEAQAAACGPPYIETDLPYPAMLREAGWRITERSDLSSAYKVSVERLLREEESHADGLRALLGSDEYGERLARRRRSLAAIEAGWLRRELFGAI